MLAVVCEGKWTRSAVVGELEGEGQGRWGRGESDGVVKGRGRCKVEGVADVGVEGLVVKTGEGDGWGKGPGGGGDVGIDDGGGAGGKEGRGKGEEYVVKLQVAVHNAVGVQIVHGADELPGRFAREA